MKKLSLVFLALLTLVMACENGSNESPGPNDDPESVAGSIGLPLERSAVSSASDRGAIVIAVRNPETGKYELQTDRLVKKLGDGTPVKYFALRTNGADFAFIRIGQDADGNTRSEAFRTSQKNGKIGILVIEEAVWYVTCDGRCSFCAPDSDGASCECPVIVDGLEIKDASGDSVDPRNVGTDGMADCTFGSGVNPLYTNKVIY